MQGINNIAIFGANGMLGRYVSSVMKDYNLTLYTRKNFDIEKDSVADLPNFDLVINCAGIIKQKQGDFYKVNSIFPKQLADRYKLIQISSDCVFKPIGKRYSWELPDAEDDYGLSKYLGEFGLVIRTSIIGRGQPLGLMDWVLSQEKINGYTDHIWNGVTCLDLAQYIYSIVKTETYTEGVRHYVGETIDKCSLCKLICEVSHHPIEIIDIEAGVCDRTLIGIKSSKTLKEQLHEMAHYNL